jgi:membrane associated rhomboid family serine protease
MIATLTIIGITSLVSLLAFNNPELMQRLILWPPAVSRHRQYDRLIGYGLIHADGSHLLFNMITLYFFGRVMEPLISSYVGEIGYVLFYVVGLVVSILPTYQKNRDNPEYRSLGASGAVSAVLFASIIVQPWSKLYLMFIPIGIPAILYGVGYVAYSIYRDRQGSDNVNHSAHLWGAAYGVAFVLVMEPRLVSLSLEQLGGGR